MEGAADFDEGVAIAEAQGSGLDVRNPGVLRLDIAKPRGVVVFACRGGADCDGKAQPEGAWRWRWLWRWRDLTVIRGALGLVDDAVVEIQQVWG
jgi:hypothetical protein